MSCKKNAIAWLALAVLACQLTGCFKTNVAWVHIDNDSGKVLQLEIDGKLQGNIGRNGCKRFKVNFGERHFTLKQNGEIVFDETKQIEPAENPGELNQYLLNPGGTAKYWVYRVESRADKANEAEQKVRSSRQSRELSVRQLRSEYRMLQSSQWVEVPNGASVLKISDHVISEDQRTTYRYFVNRVEPGNYEILTRAKNGSNIPRDELVRAMKQSMIGSVH